MPSGFVYIDCHNRKTECGDYKRSFQQYLLNNDLNALQHKKECCMCSPAAPKKGYQGPALIW